MVKFCKTFCTNQLEGYVDYNNYNATKTTFLFEQEIFVIVGLWT